MKRLFFVFSALLMLIGAFAQSSHVMDATDLDFETNISTPSIPQKQHLTISHHMRSICDAINRLSLNAELKRDGEVVTVTIPCSDLFAPNGTELKPSGKAKLQHFGKMLQYPTMYKIVVAVYSDDTGEDQYCDQLTSARANAIDDFFIEIINNAKLSRANVVPYGMGQADFRVENNSMDNRAANRRVEISIIPEWEMIETARLGKL